MNRASLLSAVKKINPTYLETIRVVKYNTMIRKDGDDVNDDDDYDAKNAEKEDLSHNKKKDSAEEEDDATKTKPLSQHHLSMTPKTKPS